MSTHTYEQPTSYGTWPFTKIVILYANELPISSHLRLKATFPVSQGWLLIAGSTVPVTPRLFI